MLVTDPDAVQAAVVAALPPAGRTTFVTRRTAVVPDRVDIATPQISYQLSRPADLTWRLVTIVSAGRVERLAGRGCDAVGLPIDSVRILAAIAPFVVGRLPVLPVEERIDLPGAGGSIAGVFGPFDGDAGGFDAGGSTGGF